MKKLLILSSLALLVAPSFSSNISTDIAGGAIKYFADDTTSSSEETTTYTITYHYNMTSWKDTSGVELLDTKTEEVVSGSKCSHQSDYYDANDTTKNSVTLWYGTYKFAGWYTDMSYTDTFKFSKEITANHDVYAKWEFGNENADVVTLKGCETKAQLYYEYVADNSSGTTNYTINNIGLRFGGFADYTAFSQLAVGEYKDSKSYIYSYGITYSTVSPKSKNFDGTFVEALNKDVYDDKEITNQTITVASSGYFESPILHKDTKSPYPAYYSETIKEKSEDGTETETTKQYYVFNVFFKVDNDSLDKTIYAAANLTLTNDKMFYFSEASYSVKSIAQKYLDTNEYTEETKDTLKMLAEGKVSGAPSSN